MPDSQPENLYVHAQQRDVRKRLRRVWALSPEERLSRFSALQAAAWATLQSNPTALAAFHRRNHAARRQSNARRLLASMKKGRDEPASGRPQDQIDLEHLP